MIFDDFGDYLLTLQLLNLVGIIGSYTMWRRAGGPMDPTDDDFPNKWLVAWLLGWLFWLVLLIVHLVYMIVIHNWLGVGIDVALLIWVWWEFFGGKGKWKRLKKRVKEKVAVIKGRLKVVPIPVPA